MDAASSDDSNTLSDDVRTAVGRVYRRFRSERTPGELGDAALAVLHHLRKHGPQSLKALSDHARVTPGSMSQTVNRLTDDGYAVRISDPTDGRKVLFEPTADGIRVSTAAFARSMSWLDSQIEQLTQPERAVLSQAASLLRRIADS
jgi:DNA-binding MarR family transcriptional regulator